MKTKFPQLDRCNSPALHFLISILIGFPCVLLPQEIQPQELYRQLYQAALADSVISPGKLEIKIATAEWRPTGGRI